MPSRAYVVLHTEPGEATRVANELNGRRSVLMADAIDGGDSAVAVFEADDASDLAGAVFITARRMPGVVSTTVYLAASADRQESRSDATPA